MRLLIAEDDRISALLLSRTLERLGHEVLVARDGEEAWNLWCETPDVEAVISDWMMPGVDGPELYRRIRSKAGSAGRYPYLILLTTLADREHFLAGLDAGADDYLSKPLDQSQLIARLKVAERITAMQKQLSEKNAELVRLNAELEELVRRDALTGLGNRMRLVEDLAALSGRAERYGHRYSVLLCDIDRFKDYNDYHGHLAGDALLKRVAKRISGSLRSGDACYRYGGEEFLVILCEQDSEGGREVAERIRWNVEADGISSGGTASAGVTPVTISLGIAGISPGSDSPEEAVRKADAALYRAKASGRNRVEVYA